MNHSIYSADRLTHCKVVVVALAAAIIIVGISTATRASSSATREAVAVIKAGKPIVLTDRDASVIVR